MKEGVTRLDVGGRAGGHVRGGCCVELGQVLQHGGLDVLQLLAAVSVLHVAHTDAQPVRVHVVIVVAQRLLRQPARSQPDKEFISNYSNLHHTLSKMH